ncbi:MAG: ATP-binding protein [Candidatus Cloacimonetes bacterium HGW-Cloacimonetes-2]|jgi:Mrp family chromosome partitioning ATPase|nr:MAG: ATP-binding protein [Candidatus Cloacimonetes bacterium HGW-Cloacimonetes-2]
MDEKELKEQTLKDNLARIKHRVVVMSGKGGVGKSFIAVNLAYALAMQGKKVGLLDADVHGPSLAKMTGTEGMEIPVTASGMPGPIKVLSNLSVLSVASLLGDPDAALIWRGPLKMALIKQFFTDFDWEELDYLIVDCPPGTGDEPLSVFQTLEHTDGTVIVTTPQDVALLDVSRSITFAEKMNVQVLGIVENMKHFVCPHCGDSTDVFPGDKIGELLVERELDLLAELDLDPNIVKSADEGKPYVYFYNKLPNADKLAKMAARVAELVETK